MQSMEHVRKATASTPTDPRVCEPERRLQCDFEAGRLIVTCADCKPCATLPFGFAERNNPRRAFLFVSRVLGRHVPVKPSLMRQAFTILADNIPADLPGPVVMTGMAETAVGLGAGVHDAYVARTARDDVLFLSTTRVMFDAPELAEFREEHSHASAHRVYQPQQAGDAALLSAARSLVMVDDEASSGDTFANLSAALFEAGLQQLERVHTAVLTDWRGTRPASQSAQADDQGRLWSTSALLYGHYEWVPRPDAPQRTLPDADRARRGRILPLHRSDDGRLGRSARSSHPAIEALSKLLAEPSQAGGRPIQVLGTGEHVWEPFLIAEALEREGFEVLFSATTRSPILPGHEVRCGLAFADHEGLGITNYLYNVDSARCAHTVLCIDTSLDALDLRLLAALRPHVMVGEVLHAWPTLAPRVRGVDAAAGFNIGPAAGGA